MSPPRSTELAEVPPATRTVLAMRWEHLLFAHWPLPAAVLQERLPAGLEIDTFDGDAWIGIVPFIMADVGPPGLPLPGRLGRFGELNVRTYVRPTRSRDGPPGVWFLSLDAANPYVVAAGRAVFHVPYLRARIRAAVVDGEVRYSSRRTHLGAPPARFTARYRATGPSAQATPGSIDDWLTSRMAVYAADRHGHVFRGDISHSPWQVAPAEWELRGETLLRGHGLERPRLEPRLLAADALDVLGRWPVRVAAPAI
jgi:uncharacterized protein YqjF (DUF2071 family)